jgi:hypothetical protein
VKITKIISALKTTKIILVFCIAIAWHTAELAQAAEHNDHQLYVVSKILDVRYNKQEMFHKLLVAWRGLSVEEATWEPYSVMAVDLPEMVAKFMKSHEDIDTVRKMRYL